MTDPIHIERAGNVATVVLNNPEKLNAISRLMWKTLGDRFEELNADAGVRCVVVRGAGEQAFAAGADVAEFAAVRATVEQARDYDLALRRALDLMRDCPHPVVAAIHGACIGGGLEVAARADIRICGLSSRFGVPVNRLGVAMAYPGLAALLRHVTPGAVCELLLEARIIDGARAERIGLVNRAVKDHMVEEEVAATVARITAGAPLVNRWHKAFIRRLDHASPVAAEEMDVCYEFLATEDYAEGLAAFRDKRRPVFRGR